MALSLPKDLEGSLSGLIDKLSQYFTGGLRKTMITHIDDSRSFDEIPNSHLPRLISLL